jgi:ribA/ribD-fused uncharacterized protein
MKGSNIWIKEHFPPEIEAERQVLNPVYTAALRHKMKPMLVKNKLVIKNKVYTVSNLDTLPKEINFIDLHTKAKDDAVFFDGKSSNPFSNLFPCELHIEGKTFTSVQHYYNYRKAQFHKQNTVAEAILMETVHEKQNFLTRSITESEDWCILKESVVKNGIRSKFLYNELLNDLLLATKDNTMLYHSIDKHWGIGVDARSTIPQQWSGENRLGVLLMLVRDELQVMDTE